MEKYSGQNVFQLFKYECLILTKSYHLRDREGVVFLIYHNILLLSLSLCGQRKFFFRVFFWEDIIFYLFFIVGSIFYPAKNFGSGNHKNIGPLLLKVLSTTEVHLFKKNSVSDDGKYRVLVKTLLDRCNLYNSIWWFTQYAYHIYIVNVVVKI